MGHLSSVILGTFDELQLRSTVSSLSNRAKLRTFVFLSSESVVMLLRATLGHTTQGC